MNKILFSPIGAEHIVVNNLLQDNKKAVYIAHDNNEIDLFTKSLLFINPSIRIARLYALDCNIPDIVSPSTNINADIIYNLYKIHNNNYDIIIASLSSIIRRYIPLDIIEKKPHFSSN